MNVAWRPTSDIVAYKDGEHGVVVVGWGVGVGWEMVWKDNVTRSVVVARWRERRGAYIR